jgi:hypothetical protein
MAHARAGSSEFQRENFGPWLLEKLEDLLNAFIAEQRGTEHKHDWRDITAYGDMNRGVEVEMCSKCSITREKPWV